MTVLGGTGPATSLYTAITRARAFRSPRGILTPWGRGCVAGAIVEKPRGIGIAGFPHGWETRPQFTSIFSPSLSITPFQSAICASTKPLNCSGVP